VLVVGVTFDWVVTGDAGSFSSCAGAGEDEYDGVTGEALPLDIFAKYEPLLPEVAAVLMVDPGLHFETE